MSIAILAGFGKVGQLRISLLTPIDSGLDVPGMLQELTRKASAGNDRENLKQG